MIFLKEERMKRFWLLLLSLGLVMAFSVSALAVDVKIGAEYYVAGMYLDKIKMTDTDSGPSTAFFYQRWRVSTDFIVNPSLKLVTRFDVFERAWGGSRSPESTTLDTLSAGTRKENENIAFDLLYVQYDSPVGTFKVGYQIDAAWGTVFMDSGNPRGTVAWSLTKGPWFFYLGYKKFVDNSASAISLNTSQSDLDQDKSAVAFKYIGQNAEGGLLGGHVRDARSKTHTNDPLSLFYYLQPYVKATLGPVKIQAELDYFWGDMPKGSTDPATPNKKLELWAGWVDATANLDMFYVGGTVAYVSGDDPNTTDKIEGFAPVVNGGIDWNPCLIMFNNDINYWVGPVKGYDNSNISGPMANALFFQGRAGIRPAPQWDAMVSVSFASADEKPTGFTHSDYGTEIDLVGTYKITNNLSYMLGLGYFFTGDYFKGKGNADVDNNYILLHKLTLTF